MWHAGVWSPICLSERLHLDYMGASQAVVFCFRGRIQRLQQKRSWPSARLTGWRSNLPHHEMWNYQSTSKALVKVLRNLIVYLEVKLGG